MSSWPPPGSAQQIRYPSHIPPDIPLTLPLPFSLLLLRLSPRHFNPPLNRLHSLTLPGARYTHRLQRLSNIDPLPTPRIHKLILLQRLRHRRPLPSLQRNRRRQPLPPPRINLRYSLERDLAHIARGDKRREVWLEGPFAVGGGWVVAVVVGEEVVVCEGGPGVSGVFGAGGGG